MNHLTHDIVEIEGIWSRKMKIEMMDCLIKNSTRSIFINFGYVVGGVDAKYVLDQLIAKKENNPSIRIVICLIFVQTSYDEDYMILLRNTLDDVFVLYHGIIRTENFPYFHLSVCHHKCALFDDKELIIGSSNYKDGFMYPDDVDYVDNRENFKKKLNHIFHLNFITKKFVEFDVYIKFDREMVELFNLFYKVISGITIQKCDLIGYNFKMEMTGINYGRKYPIIDILRESKESVDIICFHLWPRGDFYDALVDLLKRGVRVRFIIPSAESITTYFFYIVCMYHIYRLSHFGQIEYSAFCVGGSVHIKMVVSDNSRLMISSANYNEKSLNKKTESELWCDMWGDKTEKIINGYNDWIEKIDFRKYRRGGLFGRVGDALYRGTMRVVSGFIEWMF
jgi:hypothetical protein